MFGFVQTSRFAFLSITPDENRWCTTTCKDYFNNYIFQNANRYVFSNSSLRIRDESKLELLWLVDIMDATNFALLPQEEAYVVRLENYTRFQELLKNIDDAIKTHVNNYQSFKITEIKNRVTNSKGLLIQGDKRWVSPYALSYLMEYLRTEIGHGKISEKGVQFYPKDNLGIYKDLNELVLNNLIPEIMSVDWSFLPEAVNKIVKTVGPYTINVHSDPGIMTLMAYLHMQILEQGQRTYWKFKYNKNAFPYSLVFTKLKQKGDNYEMLGV